LTWSKAGAVPGPQTSYQQKNAEKEGQPDGRFVLVHEFVHSFNHSYNALGPGNRL